MRFKDVSSNDASNARWYVAECGFLIGMAGMVVCLWVTLVVRLVEYWTA